MKSLTPLFDLLYGDFMQDQPKAKIIRLKCRNDVREVEVISETETHWIARPTYVECGAMKWSKKTWIKIQEL